MMKANFPAYLFALALGLAASAATAQNLAIVNGKPVPKARMDLLLEQMSKAGRPVPKEMQGQVKEEVIAREIFVQEARRQSLDSNENVQAQIELARESILIRALFEEYEKKNPVSDAELKAEYDKISAANSGKEYRARHILVEKEDQAKAILAALKKGGKFEDIAKKQSKDPGSGAKGGDLDWANADSFVPEFSQAMTKLAKGQTVTEPVKSQFGYHIIRLDDVRQAQLPKLEDIKPQLQQQMRQQKVAKFQEELRAKAKVE